MMNRLLVKDMVKIRAFLLSASKYDDSLLNLDGVCNSIELLDDALRVMPEAEVHSCAEQPHAKAWDELDNYLKNYSVSDTDIFLFYYCGHGNLSRDGRSLLLATRDTKENNKTEVGINCSSVANLIRDRQIKRYIMILDCCHSGKWTDMGAQDLEKIEKIEESLLQDGCVYVSSTSKSAGISKEVEIDGKKYAAFTYFFAQVLKDGIENEGAYLSIETVVDQVTKRIKGSPYTDILPIPRIKHNNANDSIPIFRNSIAPSLRRQEEKILRKRVVPDERRLQIIKPPFCESELVFALAGAIGTDLKAISKQLKEDLKEYGYSEVDEISISNDILGDSTIQDLFLPKAGFYQSDKCAGKSRGYQEARYKMELGTEMRFQVGNEILAMGVVNLIAQKRAAVSNKDHRNSAPAMRPRHVYIVRSLKHPNEVDLLRRVYGNGFYLFGIYEDNGKRENRLQKRTSGEEASELIRQDEKEGYPYGQRSRETYQMSDFFINNTQENQGKSSIKRILDLIFGEPFTTPTFDEYAMFMAWCSSLRSADLSRQIGAVVCKNKEVLATGANDCPSAGGGLYWPWYDTGSNQYFDVRDGRDFTRRRDTNKAEFVEIARDLFKRFGIEESLDNFRNIRNSKLGDVTEYGRVVHAEMEAILACARNHISCRDAELYVTTFPCHNCAKHIIAAGFRKVVYIEAYPKSKTLEFYKESIAAEETDSAGKHEDESEKNKSVQPIDTIDLRVKDSSQPKVEFTPFFGVGPRRFVDMFALNTNILPDKKRKISEDEIENGLDDYGIIRSWDPHHAHLRFQMPIKTYMEQELEFSYSYLDLLKLYQECSSS